jgi:hypothetical protein
MAGPDGFAVVVEMKSNGFDKDGISIRMHRPESIPFINLV